MSIKIITRGKGKSAVAAAAYRAGEKITNEQTGIIHDYTRKQGIDWTGVMLPDNAPAEYKDRATLWNAVEKVEKASNSQLAREIEIALPRGLHFSDHFVLVRDYVRENFTNYGMCADIAFHSDKDNENPHCHIMLTMRPFNEDKTWGDKQKKVYHLDENDEKIYDPKKRQYKCSKQQTTDWNERHKAEEWRASWANKCNEYLEETNRPERIDHRSYKRQGKKQIPTIHLGTTAHQLEQRGIRTERGDINRAIKLANAEIENINARLQELEAELERLQAEPEQQEIPLTAPVPFEGYTKKFTTEWEKKLEQPIIDTPKPITAKTPKPVTKTEATKTANLKANPAPVVKPKTAPAPKPKRRTLKEVDIEINIIESKLLRLEHASSVDMSYTHKIQDIERNLNSVGFWERRKMNKEIAELEQKRMEYYKDTEKQYGTRPQLEKEKDRLLTEKLRIENATGITAAREAEQQRKRDAVIQQRQDRDRYNAERKAKRLENSSRDKNAPNL